MGTHLHCGNWPAAGEYSGVDSQLPYSSTVSRQAKTSYECVYGATRHQKDHRQQTGQYSSSRVWVTTQSPNLSTVHTGENFRFMLPLVWVQAHISLKCTQVAHERGTSPHLPDWQLVFVGSLSSGCSHTVWMLETMWVHGIRLRNSLFQPELI